MTALPQAWKVPAHNPNFTGRSRELAALAERLAAGPTVTVRGLGGVGKTQLAAEYAHAHAGDYEVVWQIAAEEPASVHDQFTELAARLGLRPNIAPEKLRAQVHDRLRAAAGWLLIFDDAERVDDIRPWLPGGAPSPEESGHVIVTTRGGFSAPGPAMDLDVIDLADAVRLLRYRVPDLDQAAGEQIAGELGRLPLALEQAAAYLDHAGVPGEEYLNLLRGQADDLAQRGQVGLLTDMIAALWRISLDRVAAEDPAAIQLLEICACLAPELVPLDLLTAHADLLPDPLSSTVAGDQVAFAETMALLVDYSLARRSLAGLQLHRLVQGAIRSRYDSLSPSAGGGPLAVAMGLLCAAAPEQTMDTWPVPPRWAVLLPHVLAVTGRVDLAASQVGSASLADASWLLDQAGIYLRSRVQPAEACPLLERALAFAEAVHGPDHPEVAAVLNDLALILRDLGQPEAAQPLLERALAIDEAAHGPGHLSVARDLNDLAEVLQELERPEAARPLQERALAIHEAVWGPEHLNVADDLTDLAGILRDLGQLEAALPLLERALAIYEAAFGPDHRHVAVALGRLAVVLRDLGRLEEAVPLLQRALAIREAVDQPGDPTVHGDLTNLAWMLQKLGQPDAARPLLERAEAIQRGREDRQARPEAGA